jgi:tryptophanyl-tRNA synthetase
VRFQSSRRQHVDSGTNGGKMSKSANNIINILDEGLRANHGH